MHLMTATAASHADIFRAVADPTRRAILEQLVGSERSVGELAEPFRLTQPAISQHLGVLRWAGLVRARRNGRQRIYRLTPEPLEELWRWAETFRRFTDPEGHVWSLRQRPRRRDMPVPVGLNGVERGG